MIKKYLFLLIVICIPFMTVGQSLMVKEISNEAGSNLNTFRLQSATVNFDASSITFTQAGKSLSDFATYGISPDLSLVGILSDNKGGQQAKIFSDTGVLLASYKVIDFSATDPSLNVYPLGDGGVLIQDNIVSFNRYDPFGNAGATISASAGSADQVIPKVAAASEGVSIFVYTSKIKNNGSLGSRISRLTTRGLKEIYSSQDRNIKHLQASEDGQFVVLITAKEGSNDQLLMLDKFGNEITRIESSEELKGANVSSNADYITVFSAGRATVYQSATGERLGSTTIGSNLILARFFAADEILLALSGDVSSDENVASDLAFHAVHFGKRKVERQEYSGSLGFNAHIKHHFVRVGTNQYRLKGASKLLEISANF